MKAPKFYDIKLFVGMRKGYKGRYLPKGKVQRVVVTDTGLGFTVSNARWEELKNGKIRKENTLIFDRITSDKKELALIKKLLPQIKKELSQEDILEEIMPAKVRFA